ncbi:hypothetical protein ABZ705_28355 [Streptomyces sp. NPDC006984]|uniref:hypothetical protein n=1 Tax=Streptomyces sp. NPDC006984 TaxID=3155463 RepID=UPI0033E6CFFC
MIRCCKSKWSASSPLHANGAADDMTAAALAWLTQQHATANGRPELPAPRD